MMLAHTVWNYEEIEKETENTFKKTGDQSEKDRKRLTMLPVMKKISIYPLAISPVMNKIKSKTLLYFDVDNRLTIKGCMSA